MKEKKNIEVQIAIVQGRFNHWTVAHPSNYCPQQKPQHRVRQQQPEPNKDIVPGNALHYSLR